MPRRAPFDRGLGSKAMYFPSGDHISVRISCIKEFMRQLPQIPA